MACRVCLFSAIVSATLISWGCAGPTDTVEMVSQRHSMAMARLESGERNRLMPYGAPVKMNEVRSLLPEDVLTLLDARSIAVRANPDIHASQARLAAAAARIAEAQARYYPTIEFRHNSTRTFHTPASRNRLNTALQPAQPVPTDIDTNSFAVTTLINAIRRPLFGLGQLKGNRNSFSENSASFTLTWIIFDGYIREAQVLASKYQHAASRAAVEDVGRLLIRAVDTAYYQVQLAEEQLRISRADETFSQDQYEETQKLRAAGRATKADVDNFRVRVLAAQADLTAAKGLRETGRVVLAELMGMPVLVLPDALTLSPLEQETPEAMSAPQATEWVGQALSNRPDLAQLRETVRSEKENIRAVRGLFLPSVAASGSWGFDRSSNLRYSVEDQSSAGGIEFRWELFSGGSRRARLRQAESFLAEAVALLSRARLQVESQVRQSVIDVTNAQEQILLQRENLQTAHSNRRIVRAGYVAGTETLTRLNEAQRDLIAADANLALARIQLRQAWTDLRASSGTFLQDRAGNTSRQTPSADD